MEIKTIDWNQLAELGLLGRINTEILHPLGLAISRNPATGASEKIMVSNDGKWEYDAATQALIPQLSDEQIEQRLLEMIGGTRV
ncbi:DUF7415 domain-containing protein [Marinomonas gallaica]|uniref:DUF7415 domain-containing protein n=1 Tax=Marinomonas gallaica TaxID=1806667 RepID=UPI003CE5A01A